MALTRPRLGQLNTSVVAQSDPITVLNQGSTQANVDVGFLFNRANGLVSNVALYWSESAQSIVTAYTNSSGVTNANISTTSYANLTVGNVLLVTGSILNVQGNIAGNTSGIHYGNVSATGNISTSGNGYVTTLVATTVNASTIGNIGANMVGTGTYLTNLTGSNVTGTVPNATTAQYVTGLTASNVTTALGATAVQNATTATYVTGLTASNVQAVIGSVSTASFPTLNQNTTGTAATVTTASQPSITTLAGLTSFGTAGVTTTALGNLAIGGNLTVTGNSVSIGASTLSITDPIINLNTPQDLTPLTVTTTADIGLKFHYYDTADSAAFLGRTTSDGYLTWWAKGTDSANVFTGTALGTIRTGAMLLANTGTALTVSDTIVAKTVNAATIGNSGATLTGTISTAAQTNITSVGTLSGLTTSGNTVINSTLYAQGIYDNGIRVVSTSSGAGNLTISAGAVTLPTTGPGAVTVGSATSIPTIVTDVYGRIVGLTSNAISTSFTLAGTTGTTTVSGGSTLSFASTNGVTIGVGATYANISTPQDIRTTASPEFAGATINGTLVATTVNAATIGNTNAVHTGSTLTLSSWANIAGPAVITNNTAVSSIQVAGTATKGGAGYHDFLSVTNLGAGVTNPNKWFRMNNTGNFEIINSAYSTNIYTLTDDGNIAIPGKATVNALYTTTGLFWAGNNNVISTGGGSTPAGASGQLQYNNGGVLGATNMYYFTANSEHNTSGNITAGNIFVTSNTQSVNTTTGALEVVGGVSLASGNLYIAGSAGRSITATGNIVVTGSASTTTTTGAIVVSGGVGVSGQVTASTLTGTTLSISSTSTLTTVNTSGVTTISSATSASSISTGALVLSGANGGMGLQGNVFAGGNVYVRSRVGYTYSANATSAVYQQYNSVTNSLDTVFG